MTFVFEQMNQYEPKRGFLGDFTNEYQQKEQNCSVEGWLDAAVGGERKRKAERKAAKAAKEAEKAGSCFKRKKNDDEDAGAASGEGAPGEPDQGVEAPKLDVEKITDVFKRLVSLRCCDVPPA